MISPSLFSGCAESMVAVARVDPPSTTADYSVIVQVVSSCSYSEVVDAANSAGISSQMEIIDMDRSPFAIKILRFRYEQVRQKDISKVQQHLSRCRGIVSVSITNE
ncbi:MAG: hypothetical protein BGP14_05340 [Sphingobacteriales bacterium 44-15]|nr:MAG: hypothetical protein BGP14_05340 [Sphingobacteriales bacterium 44-15]